MKPPSPESEITGASGLPTLAPRPVGKAYPSVVMYDEVSSPPGLTASIPATNHLEPTVTPAT